MCDLTEHWRNRATPALWVRRGDILIEKNVESSLSDVLIACGLASSKSDAMRLLKAGAIEMRRWDLGDWWRRVELHDTIPCGVAVMLRRGKAFYGVQTVMVPREGQSLMFWENFITERWT
jgi:hypothetical protein